MPRNSFASSRASTSTASVPNQGRPVIRGQRGLRVLFLENGVRLNNPRRQTDFGEVTGLVDLNSVTTIEVVRGPASVLYGTDAIGGVLNLISKDPSFPANTNFTGFVEGRYSNSGSLASGSAGVNGRIGALTMQLGGTKRQVDDYDVPSGTFGAIRLQNSTTVLDSGVHDSTVWGNLTYAASDRDKIGFRFNRYRAGQAGFGYVPANLYGVTEDVKIRILYPSQDFDRYMLSYFGSPLNRRGRTPPMSRPTTSATRASSPMTSTSISVPSVRASRIRRFTPTRSITPTCARSASVPTP